MLPAVSVVVDIVLSQHLEPNLPSTLRVNEVPIVVKSSYRRISSNSLSNCASSRVWVGGGFTVEGLGKDDRREVDVTPVAEGGTA